MTANAREMPSVQDYLDRDFHRNGQRLADHLRRYADRIEQQSAASAYDRNGRARHVSIAAEILSELRAMHGNSTMLEQLVLAASDAQRESDKARPGD